MEEEASTAPEVVKARQLYRIKMIKLSRFAERQTETVESVDLSNVPPHLLHRYTNV